jgi:hypothetical protein
MDVVEERAAERWKRDVGRAGEIHLCGVCAGVRDTVCTREFAVQVAKAAVLEIDDDEVLQALKIAATVAPRDDNVAVPRHPPMAAPLYSCSCACCSPFSDSCSAMSATPTGRQPNRSIIEGDVEIATTSAAEVLARS